MSLLADFGDFIKTPEGQGLLSGVFGYAANAQRGTPINNLGRGGVAGLLGYANAQDRLTQQAELDQTRQVRQYQIDDYKRKQEQQAAQQKWLESLNPEAQAAQAALSGGGGPTVANAAKIQPLTQANQIMWEAAKNGVIPASDYIKSMLPDNEAYTLGEGQVRYKGGRIVAQGPAKTVEQPSAVREYEFAKSQGYTGSFVQFQLDQKRAGAPSVAVNTSDPTALARAAMSFQNDFRNATKDSYVRASSYNAMLEAAKNPSAKGDITMVYSLIKALDPGSAVREGEIDLVNANRSIPDKIKGYAQRLATGQNLLPEERADLLNQARTLSFTDYTRSRNDIKAYRDNAARLTLDPNLYAPDPYAGIDFSPRNFGSTTAPMSDLPPAQQHKGRVVRDTQTGKTLKSDGMIWKEVQ